jgi:hypothetical protein
VICYDDYVIPLSSINSWLPELNALSVCRKLEFKLGAVGAAITMTSGFLSITLCVMYMSL